MSYDEEMKARVQNQLSGLKRKLNNGSIPPSGLFETAFGLDAYDAAGFEHTAYARFLFRIEIEPSEGSDRQRSLSVRVKSVAKPYEVLYYVSKGENDQIAQRLDEMNVVEWIGIIETSVMKCALQNRCEAIIFTKADVKPRLEKEGKSLAPSTLNLRIHHGKLSLELLNGIAGFDRYKRIAQATGDMLLNNPDHVLKAAAGVAFSTALRQATRIPRFPNPWADELKSDFRKLSNSDYGIPSTEVLRWSLDYSKGIAELRSGPTVTLVKERDVLCKLTFPTDEDALEFKRVIAVWRKIQKTLA